MLVVSFCKELKSSTPKVIGEKFREMYPEGAFKIYPASAKMPEVLIGLIPALNFAESGDNLAELREIIAKKGKALGLNKLKVYSIDGKEEEDFTSWAEAKFAQLDLAGKLMEKLAALWES